MLSSIHPLGERARSNRWSVTVTSFAVAATGAGAALGVVSSGLGTLLFEQPLGLWWVAATVAAAGIADLLRIPVPGMHRQVNEAWIGEYRGWVYGGAFGGQLGVGLSTYVTTWGIPALVLVMVGAADFRLGAAAGALFGLGRALPLMATAWIDRPSRLTRFHVTMARMARPAHVGAAIGLLATAAGLAVS